jgi:hypothetical protein
MAKQCRGKRAIRHHKGEIVIQGTDVATTVLVRWGAPDARRATKQTKGLGRRDPAPALLAAADLQVFATLAQRTVHACQGLGKEITT